jgi:hypothetical protein
VTASSPPAVNAIAMKEFRNNRQRQATTREREESGKNRQRAATTRKREEDQAYIVYRQTGRVTHFLGWRRRERQPGRRHAVSRDCEPGW